MLTGSDADIPIQSVGQQVLRNWLDGAGFRTAGGRSGVDRKTVRRYVHAAQAAGLVRDAGPEALTDDLPGVVREFGPGPSRRLGVLVDQLVAGSTESRIAASVPSPFVCVTGHPYVDGWQAVKPSVVGIRAWPDVPRGLPWKEGVCVALGLGRGIEAQQELWRRVLGSVTTYADLEVPLMRSVEELIDFVTAGE